MLNLWYSMLTSGSIDAFFAAWMAFCPVALVVLVTLQVVAWRKEDKANALRDARYAELRKAPVPSPGRGQGLRPVGANPFDLRSDAQRIADQKAFDESGLPRYW